jgi:hypothetical protein
MLPVQYKIHSEAVSCQSWDIINNIYEFMKREVERKINKLTLPKFCSELQQIQKRVRETMGVSGRSFRRIMKEAEQHKKQVILFGTSGKNTLFKIATEIDFDKCMIGTPYTVSACKRVPSQTSPISF